MKTGSANDQAKGSREVAALHNEVVRDLRTVDRLRRFRRYDHLPPEGCQGAWKIPDNFGTTIGGETRWRDGELEKYFVHNLRVSSDGQPYMTAVIHGKVMLIRGTDFGYQKILAQEGEGGWIFTESSILKAGTDDTLVYVSMFHNNGDDDAMPSGNPHGTVSDVNCVRIEGDTLQAVSILNDGSLMYMCWPRSADDFPTSSILLRVYREDGTLVKDALPREYKQFLQFGDRILGRWANARGEETCGLIDEKPIRLKTSFTDPTHCADLINVGDEPRLIVNRGSGSDMRVFLAKLRDNEHVSYDREIGRNEYVRGFRFDPISGSTSYVGKSMRNNLECQVVNGVPQSTFRLVSETTTIPGHKGMYYYAVAHGFLYLIRAA